MGILIEGNKETKIFNLNFQQHDYQVKCERIELVRYNKSYVKDISIITYKYNRTTSVSNGTFTFLVNIGNNMEAYTFLSNEYREFPMHFGANACKTVAANAFGCGELLKCGNFTGCPIVKERKIHICNCAPDQSKFPPFIPNGNYKMEIQAMYLSTERYVLNAYLTVSRPVFWN